MSLRRRVYIVVSGLLLLVAAGALRLSTQATATSMTVAARGFLDSLPAELRTQAAVPFESPTRLDWHFIPKDNRKGVQIKHLDAQQRKLALALLHSGLSEIGYDKATQIMGLDGLLRELEKGVEGKPLRDPERYYFTVFGDPKADTRWGWSAEGHHLSFNFVVDHGDVISTPSFFGANPAEIKGDYPLGPKRGTRILGQEEQLGFDVLNLLGTDERKVATIAEKAPAEIRAAGEAKIKKSAPEGLPGSKMNAAQRQALQALLNVHARNVAPELAATRLGEIEAAGLDAIYFAWAGADKPGIGHYYRIDAPTFVVEFINVQPDAVGNPANHIHMVWRSYENDFGLAP